MPKVSVFTTTFDPRGFVHTLVHEGSEIQLEDVKENTASVIRVSVGSDYPILVDLRKIKSISKEARDYFSMRGRKPNVTAIAMLVSSPLSKIIGNFFLGLNRPTVPTRLFSSEKEGILWMKRNTEMGQE